MVVAKQASVPGSASFLERELFNIHGWRLRVSAAIWLIVGLAFVILSYGLPDLASVAASTWGGILVGVLRLFGSTAFAVGFLSPLARMPSVMAFVDERVEGILERDVGNPRFLSKLGTEVLETAHLNILKVLLNGCFETTERSPYRTIRTKIEPLLTDVVYKELYIRLNNQVVRDADHCYIESHRLYRKTFVSPEDRVLDLGFRRHLRKISGKTEDDILRVTSVKVDGTTIGDYTITWEEDPHNGDYIASMHLETATKAGVPLVIEHRETTLLPAWDIYQWRCPESRSLLKLTLNCTFTEKVCPKVSWRGFAYDGSQPDETETSSNFTWEGWMLPDHGFILSWNDPTLIPAQACGLT